MNNTTKRAITMQRIGIKSLLHQGVKIWEKGGQVTGTMKSTIFCKAWHPYMHDIITDAFIKIKSVDIIFLNVAK